MPNPGGNRKRFCSGPHSVTPPGPEPTFRLSVFQTVLHIAGRCSNGRSRGDRAGSHRDVPGILYPSATPSETLLRAVFAADCCQTCADNHPDRNSGRSRMCVPHRSRSAPLYSSPSHILYPLGSVPVLQLHGFLFEKARSPLHRGTRVAAEQGLILVDTKYEMGYYKGELTLIDEVHTSDSSRYFYLDGYQRRFDNNLPQKQLSKEVLKEWLREKGLRAQHAGAQHN